MENSIWSLLAARGVRPDNRETWSPDHEWHLQAHRRHDQPPVETAALRVSLDDLFGVGRWSRPRDWGQVLVTFPTPPPWSPRGGPWHLDHPFASSGDAIAGVNAFLFVADVGERAGGTLILRRSPYLVARFVSEVGDLADEKMATTQRLFLESRKALREMTHSSGSDLARFLNRDFDVDGISVRVVELAGEAGDIVVCHPWALHSPSANAGDWPRIMRTSRIHRQPSPGVSAVGVR